MLKRGALAFIAVALIAAGCSSGNKGQQASATRSFKADLTAAQEVPPTDSGGTGVALVTLDPNGMLRWNVSYQALTGPAMAAHFHGPAGPGANAGVTVNIGDQGLPSPMQGSTQLNATQVADLVGGRWYINIHTARYPNGEIRGQVVPAP